MTRFLFALLVSILISSPAWAQNTQAAPDPATIPALEKIKAEGKDLAYDYIGRRYGLDVWLISGKGVMQMVYTIPETGAAVIGGLLLDPKGEEAAGRLQDEFTKGNPERAKEILVLAAGQPDKQVAPEAPATSSSPAEKLWQRLGDLGLVSYGPESGTPELYAVLDPGQPESRKTWLMLSNLAANGKIRLHVVPLALTAADHIMAIAQVLGSDDPARSWRDVMDGKLDRLPPSPDPKGAEGLQANTRFAQELKLYKLPFLVYRAQGQGGKIRAIRGLPQDWDKLLSEMGLRRAAKP